MPQSPRIRSLAPADGRPPARHAVPVPERGPRRWGVLVPLLAALVLEAFLFNLPHWQSVSFPPERSVAVSGTAGLTRDGDGYTVTDPASVWLEADLGGFEDVRGIAVDLEARDPSPVDGAIEIGVGVFDEGHSLYVSDLGTATVTERVRSTHHLRLHPAGGVSRIRLTFRDLQSGQTLRVGGLRINARVPFHVSRARVACLLAAFYLAWAFLPSRAMYSWRLDLSERRQAIVLALFLALQGLVLVGVCEATHPEQLFAATRLTGNGVFLNDENQYDHLSDALIAGRPWLDLPVPDWLPDLPNPYDIGARTDGTLASGEPTYWDYAYRDGRYYSYFGVLPAIVLYVPFRLLTGGDLRTDHAVAVLALGFLLASAYCLRRLLGRYAPRSSFGLYLLSLLGFVNGSGILTQLFVPKVYSVPVLASLALTMLGLGAWARAGTGDARRGRSAFLLAAGSLCVGLNALCRPQFLLACLLLPFLFPWRRTGPAPARRKVAAHALCAVTPFVPCAAAAMWWNQARFASPLDFGATYNLTGFDMTRADRSPVRIVWGIWYYLLQPLGVSADYPFTRGADAPSMFLGQTAFEPYYAGLVAFAPLVLLTGLLLHAAVRRTMRRAGSLGPALCLIVLGIINLALDSLVGGISMRYTTDFAWTFLIVAVLVMGAVAPSAVPETDAERCGPTRRRDDPLRGAVPRAAVAATLSGAFVSYWNLLAPDRYCALSGTNPDLYHTIQSWFLFLQ